MIHSYMPSLTPEIMLADADENCRPDRSSSDLHAAVSWGIHALLPKLYKNTKGDAGRLQGSKEWKGAGPWFIVDHVPAGLEDSFCLGAGKHPQPGCRHE